jgi:sugar lactone lactonase YvrE
LPSAIAPRLAIASLLLLATTLPASAQTPLLPSGVAYDAAGNLYFADTNRHEVFESTLAGQLIVVAGTGTQGFSGDGGPATAATLDSPQGVAIGPDGTLYIADTGNQRIRAVASGQITTFAGTGTAGFGGDNGPPAAALFSHPSALAIGASGALLICDSGNHRLRRIASGTVTTIAGSGTQGFSGDSGPATAAQLDTPSGLAAAPDGRIFIADTHNHRIRVIATNGLMTTFAGTGIAGYAGDGGTATAAQLASPRGLFVTAAGALLIADSNNQRIRQVNAQGIITTLAGNGVQGSSGDGVSATAGTLDTPRNVTLSSFSAPVIADAGNRLVRELIANGNLYAPAGLAPSRTSTIALATSASAQYGQPFATATVSGSAGTPQGVVALYDGMAQVGQATLVAGTTTFPSSLLNSGTHTLTATYLGDGVNPTATSSSANVVISQSASVTTEQTPPSSYAGLPLVLTANVASLTQGVPTGKIVFTEGATTVATASLNAGTAAGVYLAPAQGTHQIVAAYGGDANFTPSTSGAVIATVGAMPDFTLASSGSTTQTVLAGAIAVYNFTVAAQPAPFTGAVSMSVSGLPTGVTASFAPSQTVPGTGSAQVTLSLQTSANMVRLEAPRGNVIALWALLLLPGMILMRRRGRSSFVSAFALCLLLITFDGCGDRTLSAASQANLTFALAVSGTGTNLAGAAVVHSTPITLIVQ